MMKLTKKNKIRLRERLKTVKSKKAFHEKLISNNWAVDKEWQQLLVSEYSMLIDYYQNKLKTSK